MGVIFDEETMVSLFPDAWKKNSVDALTEAKTLESVNNRPCDEGIDFPPNTLQNELSTVPVKEKEPKLPEASSPELFSLQEASLKTQPSQRLKSVKQPFDFGVHIKAYEERRQKGEQVFSRILSALEGNEKACNYVRLYFASACVQWDIKKFRVYIRQNIKAWNELQRKYGEMSITNYSESIKTGELILKVLDEKL